MAENLTVVLETYRGREKIMRILQYASFLASGGLSKVSCGSAGDKFLIFAEAMSECRTVLRLFDDAAMISYARSYGTGKEEKDKIVRWTNLVDILSGLTFYPLEHIAWARDKKLLPGNSSKFWDASLYCWIVSLVACIIRDLWLLKKLQQRETKRPGSKTGTGDSSFPHSNNESVSPILVKNKQKRCLQNRLIISVIGFTADLAMAINWAPRGILWAQKLSTWSVGLLGTLSSLCELYKYFNPATTLPDEAHASL
ncbi:peroxisomal membrane protein 11C-like [Acropora muricata]|uniref:peroxisomal membrane protein 11C-like n=1 Tax=Acropora millepora TaxID=45264 RepID=UPI0010FC6FDF|nr:peroxisomal membrane protein 11C-like [Acropora millepora]